MKRARFTEEQIIAILKEHEAGAKTADLARKHGISEATIYNWKANFGGMDVSEAKRLRALEEENAKLKKLLAEQMRDELLNETLFFDLDDARAKIAGWVADYNIRRPHSSLKYLTPAAYAAHLTATDDRLRNPDQLRRSSVAPPAPLGVQTTETLTAAG
ncbi:transposase [Bradyrhizobium vignae]|uniref:Transposase n=1 Tax=Bradyrhizobium vignae TaxID=1549949 RepID=A0ABS4A0D9_9BRAD|nr:transposase [Bradyrhizobium vignae]